VDEYRLFFKGTTNNRRFKRKVSIHWSGGAAQRFHFLGSNLSLKRAKSDVSLTKKKKKTKKAVDTNLINHIIVSSSSIGP
jgi:hypothetical protein